MNGQIGFRLFQQLKSSDPAVSRDDYFDEEHNTWDVDALEQDLKVNQDRLHSTGTIAIALANSRLHAASLNIPPNNHTQNLMNHAINQQQMNALTANTIELNTNGLSTPINLNTDHALAALHPSSTHSASKPISLDSVDEDIDLIRTVSSQQTTDTNPSQMPSPNASPSIEYDASNTESDTDHNHHHNPLMHNTTNGIQTAKKTKKRKAETDIHTMNKKRKIEAHHMINKWNEVALKKLQTLKRQVRNSGWFWEPVDEVKHSAPFYYLVCPMPSDYGTICKKLEHYGYHDLDEFLRDCELVFINARLYNTAVHVVHEASMRLEKKFKESMNTFVCQHYKEYGSEKTLIYWQNAKKNYKPFAVPKNQM